MDRRRAISRHADDQPVHYDLTKRLLDKDNKEECANNGRQQDWDDDKRAIHNEAPLAAPLPKEE